MKRLLILIGALLAFALPSAAQTVVSGTITDTNSIAYNNAQVTAFTITPQQFTTFADVTGKFQFSDPLPAGTYTFVVSGPGIAPPLGIGRVQFTVNSVSISGTTQSVTATLSAAAPSLLAPGISFGGSGFANPMTTLGDSMCGGVAGVATRLAGPTGPNSVPQFLVNIPSGSAAAACSYALSGISGRTVSGTSDTILETDRGSAVTYTSASAGAIVVPQAGSTTGTSSNFVFKTRVTGAGAMTFTPATSTVNGLTTLIQTNGECTWQSFDNSVYVADCNSPSSRVGTSVTLQGISGFHVCTGTCTVTVPVPKPGSQFCVYNDDNVSTVITLAALGSSSMYENQARTAYGTAGTGTIASGGAVKDSICILGRDGTHYLFVSGNGTWSLAN